MTLDTGAPAPRRIAFHAPMKPPDHPVPSGDRRIARLVMAALETAGYRPFLASRLRTLDMAGEAAAQQALAAEARAEVSRLVAGLAADPPAAWLTYHCYWKAPDLVGPEVSAALGLPYLIVEPSISPRRREGPWAAFAGAAEAAIAHADRLFWTTERDRPALEAAGHARRMVHLPAFLDPGTEVPPRPAAEPLRLLTVAMMRPGDKAESYRRLAAGLAALGGPWRLTVAGDGPERDAVQALFDPLGPVDWLGAVENPARLRAFCEEADLLVWPGVNEGVGMAWLEAQAAGLPVVAEDGPAAQALVAGGVLAPPNDAEALAAAIREAAAHRESLSARATAHVRARHGLAAAARVLGAELQAVGT